jgi:hypothetical protein
LSSLNQKTGDRIDDSMSVWFSLSCFRLFFALLIGLFFGSLFTGFAGVPLWLASRAMLVFVCATGALSFFIWVSSFAESFKTHLKDLLFRRISFFRLSFVTHLCSIVSHFFFESKHFQSKSVIFFMQEDFFILLYIGIGIGTVSFLVRDTDFIYEYLKLFEKIVPGWIKNNLEFYENSAGALGDTFFKFALAYESLEKNSKLKNYIISLLSCYICSNTFASVIFILINPNISLLALPFLSIIVTFILEKIKYA